MSNCRSAKSARGGLLKYRLPSYCLRPICTAQDLASSQEVTVSLEGGLDCMAAYGCIWPLLHCAAFGVTRLSAAIVPPVKP